MKIENIKSPQDILTFMNENIEYGWLDKEKNKSAFNIESIISAKDSKIPIYVIPTNEELEIAKQSQKIKIYK